MHIKMHYTPTTTHHTTKKTKTNGTMAKWTKCRDGVKVLWCHSHLVWLVFEASIPACSNCCFPSENFLWLLNSIMLSSYLMWSHFTIISWVNTVAKASLFAAVFSQLSIFTSTADEASLECILGGIVYDWPHWPWDMMLPPNPSYAP